MASTRRAVQAPLDQCGRRRLRRRGRLATSGAAGVLRSWPCVRRGCTRLLNGGALPSPRWKRCGKWHAGVRRSGRVWLWCALPTENLDSKTGRFICNSGMRIISIIVRYIYTVLSIALICTTWFLRLYVPTSAWRPHQASPAWCSPCESTYSQASLLCSFSSESR